MRICVFLGSKTGRGDGYMRLARDVGRILAAENITVVYGGGSVGLMGELARGVSEANGELIGVITHSLAKHEIAFDGVSEMIYVESLEERKTVMLHNSDAFLGLPGGVGTLDEVLTVMSWNVLGYHDKQVALLNYEGYFDTFVDTLKHQNETGFMYSEWLERLLVSSDIDILLDGLRNGSGAQLGERPFVGAGGGT